MSRNRRRTYQQFFTGAIYDVTGEGENATDWTTMTLQLSGGMLTIAADESQDPVLELPVSREQILRRRFQLL